MDHSTLLQNRINIYSLPEGPLLFRCWGKSSKSSSRDSATLTSQPVSPVVKISTLLKYSNPWIQLSSKNQKSLWGGISNHFGGILASISDLLWVIPLSDPTQWANTLSSAKQKHLSWVVQIWLDLSLIWPKRCRIFFLTVYSLLQSASDSKIEAVYQSSPDEAAFSAKVSSNKKKT